MDALEELRTPEAREARRRAWAGTNLDPEGLAEAMYVVAISAIEAMGREEEWGVMVVITSVEDEAAIASSGTEESTAKCLLEIAEECLRNLARRGGSGD